MWMFIPKTIYRLEIIIIVNIIYNRYACGGSFFLAVFLVERRVVGVSGLIAWLVLGSILAVLFFVSVRAAKFTLYVLAVPTARGVVAFFGAEITSLSRVAVVVRCRARLGWVAGVVVPGIVSTRV